MNTKKPRKNVYDIIISPINQTIKAEKQLQWIYLYSNMLPEHEMFKEALDVSLYFPIYSQENTLKK